MRKCILKKILKMGLKPQKYRCSFITATFLVLFFIGIQSAYSKVSDTYVFIIKSDITYKTKKKQTKKCVR